MISIVCVYNNKKILDKYLINSLKKQKSKYKLIILDNSNNKYKSAAEAFNSVYNDLVGEYFVFLHQDIYLHKKFLEELESLLDLFDKTIIAGIAGKSMNKLGVISNIEHGSPPTSAGKFKIKYPTKVQTLDECLIIIPNTVFRVLKFDEKTCDNWHLYGVDYCLNAAQIGFESYVLPIKIYHRSNAMSFSSEYDRSLKKLLKKHRKSFNWIYTTMGDWNTHVPVKFQRNRLWNFIRKLKYVYDHKLQYKIISTIFMRESK